MPIFAPPKRYVLSGMIFIGFFVMSGLRVNLNVAIGAMVNNHTAVVDGETICRVSWITVEQKQEIKLFLELYFAHNPRWKN